MQQGPEQGGSELVAEHRGFGLGDDALDEHSGTRATAATPHLKEGCEEQLGAVLYGGSPEERGGTHPARGELELERNKVDTGAETAEHLELERDEGDAGVERTKNLELERNKVDAGVEIAEHLELERNKVDTGVEMAEHQHEGHGRVALDNGEGKLASVTTFTSRIAGFLGENDLSCFAMASSGHSIATLVLRRGDDQDTDTKARQLYAKGCDIAEKGVAYPSKSFVKMVRKLRNAIKKEASCGELQELWEALMRKYETAAKA